MTDMVNRPPHYTTHPSGVECIDITKHMTFCLGNAVKYIWRAGLKGEKLEDLKKAQYYINKEIETLESKEPVPDTPWVIDDKGKVCFPDATLISK